MLFRNVVLAVLGLAVLSESCDHHHHDSSSSGRRLRGHDDDQAAAPPRDRGDIRGPRKLFADGRRIDGGWCGTERSDKRRWLEEKKITDDYIQDMKKHGRSLSSFSVDIKTYWFVIQASDGRGFLTAAQITAAMVELNNRFAGSGFTFTKTGDTKYYTNTTWFEDNFNTDRQYEFKGAIRPASATPGDLLIYTAAATSEAAGYAFLPFAGSSEFILDGVMNAFDYLTGTTLTHEVGHWLGLHHTFNANSCSETQVDNDGETIEGDGVDDTPTQYSNTQFDCPTGRDSCPLLPGVDPINNYMDYSSDACQTEFTAGQIARMQAMWLAYRAPYHSGGSSLTSFTVSTSSFSDENSGKGLCPVNNFVQSYMTSLSCSGSYCDTLQMTCYNPGTLQIGREEYENDWFSEENGADWCLYRDTIITGIACQGTNCDQLKLTCQQLIDLEIDYNACTWSPNFPSSLNGNGAFTVPTGTYPIGLWCQDAYCGTKAIYYCSVMATPAPVVQPTPAPVVQPTPAPVLQPTPIPTKAPTKAPTPAPVQGGTNPTSGTGWRIRATASGVSRGQGQYWDVRELEFYTSPDCTTGKVDISSGTITVSGTASGSQYVASNAFDGNDSTFWGGRKSGSTFWIGIQGLSDVTVNCVTVNQKNADKIFVDLLSSGSWVEVGEFENLSDGTTDLIVNDSATAAPTPAPVQGGSPTSGTGWRIKATASGVSRGQGQYWDVRELGFYTSPDCTTGKVDVSGGTITVSGTASGSQYVASNAFDGNDSTFWGGRKSGSTFWIGMQGLSEVTVNCVTVNQKNADTIFVEVLSSGSWVEVGEFTMLSDGTTDLIVNDSATAAPTPAPVQGGTPTSGTGWRIESTAAGVSRGQGQYWDVRELGFYTSSDCTTGKVDSSTGSITVSGTASGSQYVASNAFDGNDSTFWGGRKSGSTFWIGLTGLSDVTIKCVSVNQKNADTITVRVLSSGSWVEVGEFTGLTDGTTDLIVDDSGGNPTTPTSGTGWRIKTTASGVSRGQGQYWDVRELGFFTSADCINGKVDVSGGTITVSGTASGSQYVASNAFDGNSGSFWGGRKSGSTFWIGVQGLSEVTVKCVVVNQKNADTIAVEVLSSGSWVEVVEFIQLTDGITDLVLDDSGTTPTPTSGTGWRIETTPAGVSRGQGQYWDVRELEFYTNADCINGKVGSNTGSITVSGTANGNQYVASNAFDGNDSTFWGGRANSGAFWIGLESLSEVSVKCIKVNQKNADTLSIKVKVSGSWIFVATVSGLSDGITEIDLS